MEKFVPISDPEDPRALYFNPFFESNVDLPSYEYSGELDPQPTSNITEPCTVIAAPLPPVYEEVQGVPIPQPCPISTTGESSLLIIGQGAIAVIAPDATEILVSVSNDEDTSSPALYFYISTNDFAFFAGPPGIKSAADLAANTTHDVTRFDVTVVRGKEVCYIRTDQDTKRPDTYWWSIDKKNGVLKYGKGYLNDSLTLLRADLATFTPGPDGGVPKWKNTAYGFIEKLKSVRVFQGGKGLKMVRLSSIIMIPSVPHGSQFAPRLNHASPFSHSLSPSTSPRTS